MMTPSTERSPRRHHLDGWLPRLCVAMGVLLALLPQAPFAAKLPAVATIGVYSFLLGRRQVEREYEGLMAMGEKFLEEDKRRQAVIDGIVRGAGEP
jgi:hypothetical protein